MVPSVFRLNTKRHGTTSSAMSSVTEVPAAQVDDSPASPQTSPVIIPVKRSNKLTPPYHDARNTVIGRSRTSRRSPSMTTNDRNLPMSVTTLLEATSIPVPPRRRPVRESRKLPRKLRVEDFSKMLLEGVQLKEDSLEDATGTTPLGILLSPPEEDIDEKLMAENECEHEMLSFTRSTSPESMPSLYHECDSPLSIVSPSTPASQRSPMDRKLKTMSPTQDCALDHPLLDVESPEIEPDSSIEDLQLPENDMTKFASPFRSFPGLKSTFKSNLTASLRAIKSAAQTVSTFATPSIQSDDFLTRSLFTITPQLTDDRRPLPMLETPSPALRRYLNPTRVSPAEMYVYHDCPHDPPNMSRLCHVSIQLQTYSASGAPRNRSPGFRIVAASYCDRQTSGLDQDTAPISRQREPRENSDFLRMVVLEMNMRRSGKLRDDVPIRTKVWLPPRKGYAIRSDNYEEIDESAVPSRWTGVSVECA